MSYTDILSHTEEIYEISITTVKIRTITDKIKDGGKYCFRKLTKYEI